MFVIISSRKYFPPPPFGVILFIVLFYLVIVFYYCISASYILDLKIFYLVGWLTVSPVLYICIFL